MKHLFTRLSAWALLGLLATACAKTDVVAPVSPAAATRDNNLALGNPSGATASTSSPINYLLVKGVLLPKDTVIKSKELGKVFFIFSHLDTVGELVLEQKRLFSETP